MSKPREPRRVEWTFVDFVDTKKGWAAEPTPVYEGAPPGDKAVVRYNIARHAGGVGLYSVAWTRPAQPPPASGG
eukprot:SAG31_NODE_31742_length_364_cov_2.505660_1_plen_73_part_01